MNSIKRKVFSELFGAKSVLIPILGGSLAIAASIGLGGSPIVFYAGVAAVAGGIGWMAVRAVTQIDSITQRTLDYRSQQEREAENRQLDQLLTKLRGDRDYRTQEYLTQMRMWRDQIEQLASQPEIKERCRVISEQVGTVFDSGVKQLQQSLKLYDLSETLSGENRQNILKQREQILQEVAKTTEHLHSVVSQFEALSKREVDVDLTQLRDELDASMRVAKRTEERMRELENTTSYDSSVAE